MQKGPLRSVVLVVQNARAHVNSPKLLSSWFFLGRWWGRIRGEEMEDHLTKQTEELTELVHRYKCILCASFQHPMEGGPQMG